MRKLFFVYFLYEQKESNMNINKSNISFKGYDARELQGLVFTDTKYANSVKKTLRNSSTNIDIYTPEIASKSVKKDYNLLVEKNAMMWAQDYLTFLRKPFNAVLADNSRELLQRTMKGIAGGIKNSLGIKGVPTDPHLRGGNFFICESNGKKEMLLLKDRDVYPHDFIKQLYNVDNVVEIPRLDYHLDLFLRPLDDGKVLVADNEMTKKVLEEGMLRIDKYLAKGVSDEKEKEKLKQILNDLYILIKKLEITEEFDKYKPKETVSQIVDVLQNAGYKPIRVPACYYELDGKVFKDKIQDLEHNYAENAKKVRDFVSGKPKHMQNFAENWLKFHKYRAENNPNFGVELYNKYDNNFINAIVAKQNGKLVYITNESLLDEKLGITPEIAEKIDFSTKKMFVESIKDYVDEENIHFIDTKTTEKLFKYMGGIHCTASEIPVS